MLRRHLDFEDEHVHIAELLDLHVMPDMAELLLQRNRRPVAVHQEAEVVGQMKGHFLHRFEVLERSHIVNNIERIRVKMRIDLHLEMLVLRLLHPQLFLIHIDFEFLDLAGHLVERLGHDGEFGSAGRSGQPDVKPSMTEPAHADNKPCERAEQVAAQVEDIAGDNRDGEQRYPVVEHFLEKRQVLENIRFRGHNDVADVRILRIPGKHEVFLVLPLDRSLAVLHVEDCRLESIVEVVR
ncbi:hypothetical protein D3C71_1340270 [compost metagenome]